MPPIIREAGTRGRSVCVLSVAHIFSTCCSAAVGGTPGVAETITTRTRLVSQRLLTRDERLKNRASFAARALDKVLTVTSGTLASVQYEAGPHRYVTGATNPTG